MNESLNETVSLAERASDVAVLAKDFFPLVLVRFFDLAAAPFRTPDMLWIIFPLLLTFLVLEFYFDRHGNEELGWAAAVANSLILFIVAIDLIRHSFHGESPWHVVQIVGAAVFTDEILPLEPQVLVLIMFVGALGVAVTLINYYHLLPRKLAFEVSGHPPVNFIAYFAIAVVYTSGTAHEIPLDIPSLVAGALLYVILLVIVFMIRKFIKRIFHGSGGRTWIGR